MLNYLEGTAVPFEGPVLPEGAFVDLAPFLCPWPWHFLPVQAVVLSAKAMPEAAIKTVAKPTANSFFIIVSFPELELADEHPLGI